MFKGKFITIEGSEGSGKSTNIRFVQDYLSSKNIEFISTREPGGTPVAEKIRDLLLDNANTSLCDAAELLLMFAARSQHLNELIIPALESAHAFAYAFKQAPKLSKAIILVINLSGRGDYDRTRQMRRRRGVPLQCFPLNAGRSRRKTARALAGEIPRL